MLGPLPTLHRLLVALVVIVAATAVGIWAGTSPQVPVLVPGATGAALALGALLCWGLVQPWGHDEPTARHSRPRR